MKTKILMCSPKYFDIHYEINPWMRIAHRVNRPLAAQQWQTLEQTIIQCGGQVELISPKDGLPDLVFTANCGLRVGRQIYLSRFKHPERQGEREFFKSWFEQAGYSIASESADYFDTEGHYTGPSFEGAGDALFLGDTLFAAYGFRTDPSIYPYLFELFNIQNKVLCELTDPHFYHLDTCFCSLNDHQGLWFPAAFSAETQERMKKTADLYAVPADEERSFACNTVILGEHAIIPERCPHTRGILEKLHFNVRECPMTEFIKSGGACKCLTFELGSRKLGSSLESCELGSCELGSSLES